MSPLEVRVAHLEGAYEQTNQRSAAYDLRFEALDRIDQRFMWTIGIVPGTWLSTIVAVFLHR